MERQEKGNMDIFGSGIRHRTGVPKAQSSSDADSVTARTFQQTQTEADNATARQKGNFTSRLSSSNITLHLDRISLIIGIIFNINIFKV